MQLYFEQQSTREPWNEGKFVGQKAPLKLKEIWAIRIRLQMRQKTRDLALLIWQSTASYVQAIS